MFHPTTQAIVAVSQKPQARVAPTVIAENFAVFVQKKFVFSICTCNHVYAFDALSNRMCWVKAAVPLKTRAEANKNGRLIFIQWWY